ncbi:MAG TPA: sigma factor [Woeseiaceae bacterium]|nr:sigma factor [Woeseiaceae bacterium]
MSDTEDLIEAAKAGSVSAFTELVHEYREGLLRFLVTRSGSFADAEDALQDALINAYRYLDSYDSRWRFSTWLYRIALRNLASQGPAAGAAERELVDEEADPLLHCIAHSERQNLWLTARRVLSDDVFTAMWLRYVEDASINDISRVLDRSGSWTKVNLLRARKALDAELNKAANGSKAYG